MNHVTMTWTRPSFSKSKSSSPLMMVSYSNWSFSTSNFWSHFNGSSPSFPLSLEEPLPYFFPHWLEWSSRHYELLFKTQLRCSFFCEFLLLVLILNNPSPSGSLCYWFISLPLALDCKLPENKTTSYWPLSCCT